MYLIVTNRRYSVSIFARRFDRTCVPRLENVVENRCRIGRAIGRGKKKHSRDRLPSKPSMTRLRLFWRQTRGLCVFFPRTDDGGARQSAVPGRDQLIHTVNKASARARAKGAGDSSRSSRFSRPNPYHRNRFRLPSSTAVSVAGIIVSSAAQSLVNRELCRLCSVSATVVVSLKNRSRSHIPRSSTVPKNSAFREEENNNIVYSFFFFLISVFFVRVISVVVEFYPRIRVSVLSQGLNGRGYAVHT